MTLSQDFFLVVPNYGRSGSDDAWETIDAGYIELWGAACDLLAKSSWNLDGNLIEVQIDWRPLLARHKRSYAVMKKLTSVPRDARASDSFHRILEEFPRRPSRVRATVSLQDDSSKVMKNLGPQILENLLHDVFLAMNISQPGSCDFYGARITNTEYPTDVSLSNTNFDSSLDVSLHHGWPRISTLELTDVARWYRSVHSDLAQIPNNPMERALFAVLHMAKIDATAVSVVWLFYAFESLLQTKPGENFATMVARICLLLDANASQASLVKKQMRSLYNTRSAIVHGGYEVIHPMHNEILDDRVDDVYGRLVELTRWGQAFLLACIQRTIQNGWLFPRFSEVLDGEPIEGPSLK
ncbi:MAG: HEPN domain-containing protein [Methyloceanibacter sp.]|nr:HEPN domain-containing protein [Methyloceanibacter sp.]